MRKKLAAAAALLLLVPSLAPAAECTILLHGLARSPSSMAKLGKALEQAGYLVVNRGYPSRDHSVAELVPMAIDPALQGCRDQNAEKIHFVTHSLGGILVRAYLGQGHPPELGRVVMLGPPNQGSEVIDALGRVPAVKWLNGPAGADLGTNGVPASLGPADFDVGIVAGTRSINLILSLYLPNPDDGKVSVASARLEGMNDFLTVPVSHPFLMRNRQVIAQTLSYLANGSFDRQAL